MKMKTLCTCLIAFGWLAVATLAQEKATVSESDTPPAAAATPAAERAEPAVEQPVIPVPYAASRYDAAWGKNPFLLKTAPPTGPNKSWADDWALAGMFNNSGKIRVSLVNKQTGEYKNLSNQGPPDPEFRLVKANFNRDRTEASADIAKGEDEKNIKYDDNLTSKPITVNNTQAAAPGAAGKPGVPTPVKPGAVPPNAKGAPTPPGAAPTIPRPVGVPGANPAVRTNTGPVPITPATPSTGTRRRTLIPGTAQPRQ